MLDVVKLTDHQNLQGSTASVDAEEGIRQGLERGKRESSALRVSFSKSVKRSTASLESHPVGAKADKAIASTKHA
jgi:hypothetical protein